MPYRAGHARPSVGGTCQRERVRGRRTYGTSPSITRWWAQPLLSTLEKGLRLGLRSRPTVAALALLVALPMARCPTS